MQKAKTKIVPPYKHKPSATPKRKKEYLTSTRRILTFALIAAVYWFIQNPPGVTMINPARPPDPILEPAEVEKIRSAGATRSYRLQILGVGLQGDLVWLDAQTAVYLSNNANGDPVVVSIQLESEEIRVEVL
jgi:hypothetical protein